MRILIVDDEPLARSRLKTLLGDCEDPAVEIVGEACNADEALAFLRGTSVDLALLDIHMPGVNGLELAQVLRELARPPAVVFVTAHSQHALEAFEIEAVDYLTKPVRLERLSQALRKAERSMTAPLVHDDDLAQKIVLIQERGRTERVPLAEVLYFRSELKYVTVRTAARSYLLESALSEIEQRYAATFLRVHRSALVARGAVRALERQYDEYDNEGWTVRLNGIDELIPVSRRQVAAVRDAIAATSAYTGRR